MAVVSSTDFVAFLIQNQLLEPEQLDELLGDLRARFPAATALSRELVRRGWLTAYQVHLLTEGKGTSLLLGQYLLLEPLGAGGMGEVFKARHRHLGRVVALKILRRERLAQPEAVHRFRREIQAAAQLTHRNVVHAYDADEVAGRHFYTMEFVEGTDLYRLVRQSGPLPIRPACDYVRQAALGLQHAHERGLVHRDVKPSNLLCTPDEIIKILDMGLVLLLEPTEADEGVALTQDHIIGTPDYIAPEQARNSHHVDIRSDLYSLGCTFYFLLAGRVPFPHARSVLEKLIAHQTADPKPVEALRPDVPPRLRALLRRLMSRNIAARYQTPAEVAAALAPFAKGDPAAYAGPAAAADEDFATTQALPGAMPTALRGHGGEPCPRKAVGMAPDHDGRRVLIVAIVIMAICLLGLVGWLVFTGRRPAGTRGAAGVAPPPFTVAAALDRPSTHER